MTNSFVYVLSNSDSASLGAAFRAKYALANLRHARSNQVLVNLNLAQESDTSLALRPESDTSLTRLKFHDEIKDGDLLVAAKPNPESVAVYETMLPRYRRLENSISAGK